MSLFGYLRLYNRRVSNIGSPVGGYHYKASAFRSIHGFNITSLILCFLVFVVCCYIYLFPIFHTPIHNIGINKSVEPNKECNLFDGKWVPDESYPLYNSSQCPFAERGFDCLANGRKDEDYLKWRWKPRHCEIPNFDAISVLNKLHGKRVVFVGDSLSRTQWESMICMLMTGVKDKKSVYEINGNEITKKTRHLGVKFSSFNLVIEFYRSVFLVQPGSVPKHSPKRVKSTLKLDVLDGISNEWVDSDILVFNSGHWWTPTKLFEIQGLLFPGWCKNEARNVNKFSF